jgi:hypothetical protein
MNEDGVPIWFKVAMFLGAVIVLALDLFVWRP